ncbi:PHP domain-containing protein, partial [Atlantibacter hermannii]
MSHTSSAVIYDLHSHTVASDGALTPEQLVHRAVEMGITTLAITDHDSTAGLPAAHQEIARANLPLQLINGTEISTLWEYHEIHIVGLGMDITHPALVAFLAEQHERRNRRAEMIAERLAKARIPGAWEGALRLADGGTVTRGHFAKFLIEDG